MKYRINYEPNAKKEPKAKIGDLVRILVYKKICMKEVLQIGVMNFKQQKNI